MDLQRKFFTEDDFEFASYLMKDSIRNWKMIWNENTSGVNTFISKSYFFENISSLKSTKTVKYEIVLDYSIEDLIEILLQNPIFLKNFDSNIIKMKLIKRISFEDQCRDEQELSIPFNTGIQEFECQMKSSFSISSTKISTSFIWGNHQKSNTTFCILKSFKKESGSPKLKTTPSKNETFEPSCHKIFGFKRISKTKTHFSLIDASNLGGLSSKLSNFEFFI